MTASQWLSLTLICFLGAATPGPSLVVIMRVALTAGRLEALLAAWSHALAIGAYAALSLLFFTSAQALGGPWFWAVVVAGQGWLLYLGIGMIRASRKSVLAPEESLPVNARWYQGLIIGLINPKIWLFFTAVFSPFVSQSNVSVSLALLPFVVDGLWYSLIVLGITKGPLARWLVRVRRPMDAILGGLLIALALLTLQNSLPNLMSAFGV